MNSPTFAKTKKLVLMAILTAMVVVLQLVASAIKFGPFSITLSLIPIIVGAAVCGAGAGAYLGLVFGVVVLLSGDAALFLAVNLPATVLIVLLKGALAGLAAGLTYRLIAKKNKTVAAFGAGLISPVVNTGVFYLGCLLFFKDFCVQTAEGMGLSGNVFYVIAAGFIGFNFFAELLVNMLLSGALVILLKAVDTIMRA